MCSHAELKEAFESVFGHIHTERMQSVPILNEALEVGMTDFVETAHGPLAVLVTPWFINAVLLDAEPGEAPIAAGTKRSFALPAGPFEFIRSIEDELGGFWMCSLFSPVFEFADQETAMQTAEASLEALIETADGAEDSELGMEAVWRGDVATLADMQSREMEAADAGELSQNEPEVPAEVSRRAFLSANRSAGEA